ncbi:BRcat domain-containing protein [Caproiciproducens sp. LBM24188]
MDRFRQWMMGRYGPDQLTYALLIGYLVLYLVAQIARFGILALIAMILLVLAVVRMFSRNTTQRYRENQAFLRFWNPISGWFRRMKYNLQDRQANRIFKCPNCSSRLRVPRGRGKVEVTCPVCRTRFIKKT